MMLCCGESLIDMIPSDTADGRSCFVPHPGGAVFNTAIALGRLGVDAGMLTGLSTDLFGVQLRRALEDSHVDTRFAVSTERPTTLAFVALQDGQASYSFFDENSALRMLSNEEIPALDPEIDCLFFGGISLASEPCADTFASLLEREGKTRLAMLDPNIRQSFIADEGRFRGRMKRMMELSDIVKVSDEDLDWLVPRPLTIRDQLQSILELGPSLVVATMGSAGAIALSSAGVDVEAPAVHAEVVDTVGAGDTFNAGFLAGLFRQDKLSRAGVGELTDAELESALGLGSAAAAVTVSRAGANPPWDRDLM
ncbi:MAG: carbohydrate kinase [Boseongicola sp.]|nr:carbohydrate kinase [Boseongicola sp.]